MSETNPVICTECPYYQSLQVAKSVVSEAGGELSRETRSTKEHELALTELIFKKVMEQNQCDGPDEKSTCSLSSRINDARSFMFQTPDIRMQANGTLRPGFQDRTYEGRE